MKHATESAKEGVIKAIDKAAEHEGKKIEEKDKADLKKKMDSATDVGAKVNDAAKKV